MKIKVFFLLAPLVFSACIAFHSGNVSSGPLMSINDTYVETVTGSARSTAILVFSDPQFQLIADARKNLIHNRKLNRDEYFSNFSADIRKELIFGIVYVTKVIVSADVMRNHNEPRPELKITSQFLKSPNQLFISGTDTFRLGETVYYTRNKSYYSKATIDFINREEVTFLDEIKGNKKMYNPSRITLYSTINRINGFQPGDSIAISDFDPISNKKKKRVGVILGLNSSEVLVNTDHGSESQSYLVISKLSE